jgi:hypothetical protein
VPYTLQDLQTTLISTRATKFAGSSSRYVTDARCRMAARRRPASSGRNPGAAGSADDSHRLGRGRIDGPTLIGSPFYEAGLDRGDMILTLDSLPLTSDSVFRAITRAHQPGEAVPVTYRSRGRQGRAHVALAADERLEVGTYEEAGMPVTEAIQKFRQAWLGPHEPK